jgi:hypothetical protein
MRAHRILLLCAVVGLWLACDEETSVQPYQREQTCTLGPGGGGCRAYCDGDDLPTGGGYRIRGAPGSGVRTFELLKEYVISSSQPHGYRSDVRKAWDVSYERFIHTEPHPQVEVTVYVLCIPSSNTN